MMRVADAVPCRHFLVASVLFALAPTALAQDVRLSGESLPMLNRLRAADKRLTAVRTPGAVAVSVGLGAAPLTACAALLAGGPAADDWELLLDEYHRLAQEGGDSLVAVPEAQPFWTSARGSVQPRQLAHRRLARLPRTVLDAYRQRVDVEARRLLAEGKSTRSPGPLRRLVDEMFCSRPAEHALDLLGDLAFERGDFDDALAWWALLTPLPGDARADDSVRYPGPTCDLAQIQAKQILALIFRGAERRARAEISLLRSIAADRRGHLAGRDGSYVEILDEILATHHADDDASAEPWSTFGGDASRGRILGRGLAPALWEDGPTWEINWAAAPDTKTESGVRRRVPIHPVIARAGVFFADDGTVYGHDLKSGKERWHYRLAKAEAPADAVALENRQALRSHLTIDGSRLYANLGRQSLGPHRHDAKPSRGSYLVCLDLAATPLRELWVIQPLTQGGLFESAPLVRDGQVYVAVSRVVAKRTQTVLVCYDAQGRLRWSRDVCDVPEFEAGPSARTLPNYVTWAGTSLVYCSHAGAVIAVDPWSGHPRWAFRYPSRPRHYDSEPSARDAAPCVFADGRIVVGPRDADRLFCIDAATGRVAWEREGVEAVHVLGITGGRVIVATPRGLQGHALTTGRVDWAQPALGSLASLGRGLVAGPWVFWPTQDARLPVRAIALDGETSTESEAMEPTRLRRIPAGNMAFGQECLAVAGVSRLSVFVPVSGPQLRPPDTGEPWAIRDRCRTVKEAAVVGEE